MYVFVTDWIDYDNRGGSAEGVYTSLERALASFSTVPRAAWTHDGDDRWDAVVSDGPEPSIVRYLLDDGTP